MLRFSLGVARLVMITNEHIRGTANADWFGDKVGGKVEPTGSSQKRKIKKTLNITMSRIDWM